MDVALVKSVCLSHKAGLLPNNFKVRGCAAERSIIINGFPIRLRVIDAGLQAVLRPSHIFLTFYEDSVGWEIRPRPSPIKLAVLAIIISDHLQTQGSDLGESHSGKFIHI